MEEKYIIFEGPTNRSKRISHEIMRLMNPTISDEQLYFGHLEHPIEDKTALIIDVSRLIKVHPDATFDSFFNELSEVDEIEKNEILNKMDENGIVLVDTLLPSNLIRHTYEELKDLGWFNEEVQ